MATNPAKLINPDFEPLPGTRLLETTEITIAAPEDVQAIAYLVGDEGEVPPELGFSREGLENLGFSTECGTTQFIPTAKGPDLIAVGAGSVDDLDGSALRTIAAAAVNAAKKASSVGIVVPVEVEAAARFLTEGALLARYRYTELKTDPKDTPLTKLALQGRGLSPEDVAIGVASARATTIARDLTNTPPGYLTATDLANVASALGNENGFEVKVFGKEELIDMGCGGLLGVNRGSFEPPRMVRMHYRPENPAGHIGLVGKGITYDSGGVNLKPSDGFHLLMKMDMGGAGAIVGTMSALAALKVPTEVTAWIMCTDNMISGDAYRLGDVLTAANGTTVEVKNTDAEGRLVLMDGISLAAKEGVDAIVDIATLTGAAMVALGDSVAATFATDDGLARLLDASSQRTGEATWRLPLVESYRKSLDSLIADMANVGSGRAGGAIKAALFLQSFAGDTPWAHVDIAGPMNQDSPEGWLPAGATGFGARLLLDVVENYPSAKTSD